MPRFLIADDHAIVISGLRQLLLQQYPSAIIEEVPDAESLFEKVTEKEWDLIITDFNMPGRTGLDALRQIKMSHPKIPILLMSMYSENKFGIRAIKAGASGYLGKDRIHEELLIAVKMVLQGRRYITPAIAEQLANALGSPDDTKPHEDLSDREFEVFKMLAEGKSTSSIAEQLMISPSTISTYRARIMEKMKMNSNADLTRYAMEENII